MTTPTKCPKCGKPWNATWAEWRCLSFINHLGEFTQSAECKLRVTRRQLRREKARLDALEKDGFGVSYSVDLNGTTLRQLADKLLAKKGKK